MAECGNNGRGLQACWTMGTGHAAIRSLYILTLAYMLLTASSCDKNRPEAKDDVLSLPVQNYTGNEIRTEGYWYRINEYNGIVQLDYCTFFYRNGVIFGGISVYESDIEQKEEEFRNGLFYIHNHNSKGNWGRFIVEGNVIKYERWYPGEPPLPAYVRAGIILNDTTFKITEVYRMQNGQKTEAEPRNEMYYFKALSPKPDSTNSYTN